MSATKNGFFYALFEYTGAGYYRRAPSQRGAGLKSGPGGFPVESIRIGKEYITITFRGKTDTRAKVAAARFWFLLLDCDKPATIVRPSEPDHKGRRRWLDWGYPAAWVGCHEDYREGRRFRFPNPSPFLHRDAKKCGFVWCSVEKWGAGNK